MFKSGLFLFLGLFLGRTLGLLRELVIAVNIGSNTTADIIIGLITLPDIVVNILLGNALASVFVPAIKKLPITQRLDYFYKLSAKLGSITLCVVALAWWKIDFLANLILPSSAIKTDFQQQLMWIICAVPLIALSAVSRVFLQAENKFTLLGLENVIFNIILILGIFAFSQKPTFELISLSVLIGSALRWALQTVQVWLTYKQENKLQAPAITWVYFKRYSLALVTGIFIQLLPIYGRSIASFYMHEGALSIYNYAYKFIEVPMALGITVISTILFPKMSELAVSNKTIDHYKLVKESQQLIITLCLPASLLIPVGLFLFKDVPIPLKNISQEGFTLIISAVAVGFIALLIRGLNELYVTILNSMGDVKSPMYATLMASIIGGVSISLLTRKFGILGAFWGLNISYLSNWFINILTLKNKEINIFNGLGNRKNTFILLYTCSSALTSFTVHYLFSKLASIATLTILIVILYLQIVFDLINKRKKGLPLF